jgi:hypothetical protein
MRTMAMLITFSVSTFAANVTLSFRSGYGIDDTDSGECAPGTNCFSQPICPRGGCFLDAEGHCYTSGYCNAGQAYCEVDNSGRFRAYLKHLDAYCEMDGLDCNNYDCEAYGEWVAGTGTSTATLSQSATCSGQGEVICSTTMFSPPPPNDPPSPSQPFTYECSNYCSSGCDKITWANTTDSNGYVTIRIELGDESTVSAALAQLCDGSDPTSGESACVDYLDTFELSQDCEDRRSASCAEEHTSILRAVPSFVRYGRAMENVCYFHTHCEAKCGAEVCTDITEGRCVSGGDGCGYGVLEHICASSECLAFLEAEDAWRRQLFAPVSRRGVPAFIDAEGICAAETAGRIWLIILGVIGGLAVVGTVGGVYACQKWNCCKCCTCCDCPGAAGPAKAISGGNAQTAIPVASAMA